MPSDAYLSLESTAGRPSQAEPGGRTTTISTGPNLYLPSTIRPIHHIISISHLGNSRYA